MSKFEINQEKFINDALSQRKRQKPVLVALLNRLLSLFSGVHAEFTADLNIHDCRLKYFPGGRLQVEGMLNDVIDAGITVVNNNNNASTFYAFEDGGNNKFAYEDGNTLNAHVYGDIAYDPIFKNFTVFVPTGLNADLGKIRRWVNYYLRPGIEYTVELI